ncbi:MAG: PQQ-binding-like beta-propeller repeat protein [Verrucomicrobiota bacterium]
MKSLSVLLSVLVALSTFAMADWTQYRGPNGQGLSGETVPVEWSESKNLKWKLDLNGEGSSSPVISGGSVFVTTFQGSSPNVTRFLHRVDFETGKLIWSREIPVDYPEDAGRGFILEHGWASNTPVTDGKAVYGYFGKAGVYSFDFEGELLWKIRTGSLSSQKRWGSASSPILYNGLLIVPAGDELTAILALDTSDGSEKWRVENRAFSQTYGTPVLVEVDASRTDLVFAATGIWKGLDPTTGAERWSASYNLPGNMSNTTHVGDGILTISGGFPRTARVALPIGGSGDLSGEILYDTQKPATYMTAPVELDGVLYWISDSGIAFAAKPGEASPLWQERVPDLVGAGGRGKPFYASPILAGGKIYAVSRANGTFVIEPSPDGLKVLAQNRFASDETLFNATPAVSGGSILLRSQKALYCVGQ